MSAEKITDIVVNEINDKKHDLIIVNYSNMDTVGHTGNFDATVKAAEEIDSCVDRVAQAINMAGGILLITSDHGKAEQMIEYKTGEPYTAHTTNAVPLILIGLDSIKLKNGRLSDIAPTLLNAMGIEKPQEMSGTSLIMRK